MYRRNEYDVSNSINTTDSDQVSAEVCRIYEGLYQKDHPENMSQAFRDLTLLYGGEYPGYHACETHYHDVQHVLDVTLAMARLMDGCVRGTTADVLTEPLFRLGIMTALYHDCGYIRHRKDTKHSNGAEYTKTHVSRGGRFLEDYLVTLGMADIAPAAAATMQFTGYETPVDRIRIDPEFKLIGNLLGSADILAQMADRCYLEKCYDRLYPEFVSGGIARQRKPDGTEQVVFESAADLIFKTPHFYETAQKRLKVDLHGYCDYVAQHFDGENPYVSETDKNIRHAEVIAAKRDLSLLRRKPPSTTHAPEVEQRLI
jgi:hypothetical protein